MINLDKVIFISTKDLSKNKIFKKDIELNLIHSGNPLECAKLLMDIFDFEQDKKKYLECTDEIGKTALILASQSSEGRNKYGVMILLILLLPQPLQILLGRCSLLAC